MLRGVADSQRGKDRNSPNETAEGSFYLLKACKRPGGGCR